MRYEPSWPVMPVMSAIFRGVGEGISPPLALVDSDLSLPEAITVLGLRKMGQNENEELSVWN